MKVAHIYASNAKRNSGDFMLGKAAKWYFEKYIAKKKCVFTDLDCRNANLYSGTNVDKLNSFDAIMVGPGGLILPDSAPNKISCWQWVIHKNSYPKIKVPIHVIAIGWNLFYGQTLDMQGRDSRASDKSRTPIFRENMRALIRQSASFSMRHKADIGKLLDVVGREFADRIKWAECPTMPYVRELWKDSPDKAIAIEIKTDRENVRYGKIGKNKVYADLVAVVRKLLEMGEKVVHLSHDGSLNFQRYCSAKGVSIPSLRNDVADAIKIRANYKRFDIIVCTAGHSQMISHALGKLTLSLNTHPKTKAFSADNATPLIELDRIHHIPEMVKSHRVR